MVKKENILPSISSIVCASAVVCLAAGAAFADNPSSSSPPPWDDYKTILWMGDSAYKDPSRLPLVFQRLKEMGINTAMVYGDGDPGVPVRNEFPYYVENIVNRGLCLKWNSKVTNWDAFVTQWRKDGSPDSALVRDYCLDDPQWRDWAAAEVRRVVSKNQPHHPVAYNLRDELSTTLSANPFDYDFNPIALDHFRRWLQTQYPSLEALNAEWQTKFDSWDKVVPFTTDQVKNRMASGEALPRGHPDWQASESLRFDPATAQQNPTRWNFAPWADFRTYMDISLAGTLHALRQTARAADPATPVGIEGTQMPDAFGGYDLWRLSQALDWVEPYDIGNAREIFGSFMPGRNIITTVFESDTDRARRRLWHLLLEGDRGCIVWWSEDCIDWQSPDLPLTRKAHALSPVLREMNSPLARLFLRATPVTDPIYILYSQASIQADWLIESTVDGSTWLRRFSSFEADHNEMARNRDGWLKALQDAGFSPQFISTEQLEAGQLNDAPATAALIFPECYALSDKSFAAIEDFSSASRGHEVLWDIPPGLFDEHAKLRATLLPFPPSPGAYASFLSNPGVHRAVANTFSLLSSNNPASYSSARLATNYNSALRVVPGFKASLASLIQGQSDFDLSVFSCVRVHRYHVPAAAGLLIAVERNIDYHMSEDLAQATGNERLEKPIEVHARLSAPAYLYDLRDKKYLGFTSRLSFTLQPWQPSLFAVLPAPCDPSRVVTFLSSK